MALAVATPALAAGSGYGSPYWGLATPVAVAGVGLAPAHMRCCGLRGFAVFPPLAAVEAVGVAGVAVGVVVDVANVAGTVLYTVLVRMLCTVFSCAATAKPVAAVYTAM